MILEKEKKRTCSGLFCFSCLLVMDERIPREISIVENVELEWGF